MQEPTETLSSKKNIITRIDFNNNEYEFELSSPSYRFMQACCTEELDTPNKVVRVVVKHTRTPF